MRNNREYFDAIAKRKAGLPSAQDLDVVSTEKDVAAKTSAVPLVEQPITIDPKNFVQQPVEVNLSSLIQDIHSKISELYESWKASKTGE